MSAPQLIYCTFCGQTYLSSSITNCSLCGKEGGIADPDSPEALRDLRDKKYQESRRPPLRESFAIGTGVVLLVVGLTFVIVWAFDEDAITWDLSWFLGVPSLLVGATILVMLFLSQRRKRS